MVDLIEKEKITIQSRWLIKIIPSSFIPPFPDTFNIFAAQFCNINPDIEEYDANQNLNNHISNPPEGEVVGSLGNSQFKRFFARIVCHINVH